MGAMQFASCKNHAQIHSDLLVEGGCIIRMKLCVPAIKEHDEHTRNSSVGVYRLPLFLHSTSRRRGQDVKERKHFNKLYQNFLPGN